MNYHLSLPPAMINSVIEALTGKNCGMPNDADTLAIGSIAAIAALKWHTENPLVPISEKTDVVQVTLEDNLRDLTNLKDKEIRFGPSFLAHLRSALASADLKKYIPEHTRMKITEKAIFVWSDESVGNQEVK